MSFYVDLLLCFIIIVYMIGIILLFKHVGYVFTKAYRNSVNEEIKCKKIIENNLNNIKLKNNDYDIDEMINILRKQDYKSNFKIPLKNNI